MGMEASFGRTPKPAFEAALCAFAAVILHDFCEPPLAPCLGLCVAALAYALKRPGRRASLLLIFAVIGMSHVWRHNLSPSRALALKLAQDAFQTVQLEGRVVDVPSEHSTNDSQPRCTFFLDVEMIQPTQLDAADCTVLVHWKGPSPTCGDKVLMTAALRRTMPPRNPGERDSEQFLKRHNVWVEAFVRHPMDARVVRPAVWHWKTTASSIRDWTSLQLMRGIEDQPQMHHLLASMVLGIQKDSLQEMHDWFRDTGTLHLFAVSGLNLSMLAAFLNVCIRLLSIGFRTAWFLTLSVLTGYAVVTGMGPSCVRALVMSALVLSVGWTGRPSVPLNSLGVAALLLLAADGNCAFDVGFQLSFGLVLSFIYAGPLVSHLTNKWFSPDVLLPSRLWTQWQRSSFALFKTCGNAAGLTFVSWLAGMPWCVLLFHQVTPIAILVNLVAVPLSFINLALGFLSVLGFALGSVSQILNRMNARCAGVLLDFVRWGSAFPNGHFVLGRPFAQQPSLVVFDFGEGAAVLLRDKNINWLLDCGSEAQATGVLNRALQEYGVDVLDGLVLSHGDTAHIGGASIIQQQFHPLQVVDSTLKDRSQTRKKIHAAFRNQGVPLRQAKANEVLFEEPSMRIEVLYPPDSLNASLADDKSLVLRWITPQWTVLYTSDAGWPTEQWLLNHAQEALRSDIWIRGSHARETSGCDAFVKAVSPRMVIVSGSRTGQHHGANTAWASRWSGHGMTVWLQEQTGAVEAWSGGKEEFRAYVGKRVLSSLPPRTSN